MEALTANDLARVYLSQEIARKGIERIDSEGGERAPVIGDTFLKSIEEKGTEPEKIIARCGRMAADTIQHKKTLLQKTVLSCIAEGVGGPVGQVLAGTALKCSESLFMQRGELDAAEAGEAFMKGIEQYGSPMEKEVALVTRESCNNIRYEQAAMVQQKAFSRITGGLAATSREELLDLGIEAISAANNDPTVGDRFLAEIEAAASPGEKAVIGAVRKTYMQYNLRDKDDICALQVMTLQKLQRGLKEPAGHALAKMGKTMVASSENKPLTAKSMLGAVADASQNEREVLLARVGFDVIDGRSDFDSDREIADLVFDEILNGTRTNDEVLARIGDMVINPVNTYKPGGAARLYGDEARPVRDKTMRIIGAIAEHGQDPKNREIARRALKKTEGGTVHKYMHAVRDCVIHERGFGKILDNEKAKPDQKLIKEIENDIQGIVRQESDKLGIHVEDPASRTSVEEDVGSMLLRRAMDRNTQEE